MGCIVTECASFHMMDGLAIAQSEDILSELIQTFYMHNGIKF